LVTEVWYKFGRCHIENINVKILKAIIGFVIIRRQFLINFICINGAINQFGVLITKRGGAIKVNNRCWTICALNKKPSLISCIGDIKAISKIRIPVVNNAVS
tara:strand:+ start:240 stop:545 length:306 start_codon:yes stop_codon:yes gene_type:complete